MAFVLGLRERKKLATREALGCAALRLAVARGIDNVLVEDVAAAADVSPRTFNNYFASKQEAMCAPAMDRAHRIGEALRARPDSESLWAAIVHAVLAEHENPPVPDAEWLAGLRLVTTAPQLQGEYLKVRVALQCALVRFIADRTGRDLDGDLYPHVLAGAVAAALDVATGRWIHADPPAPPLPLFRDALRQLTLIPGEFPADIATAHSLALPGARVHYRVRGSGPLLLLIPGGTGTGDTYDAVAAQLADRFTVVTYTRRGFGGSPADSVPADRLAADAADASRLLAHLAGAPAVVFGSSSGAIVGLRLLAEHPEQIRVLVAHEPPLFGLLPDGARHLAFLDDVHATSLREGHAAAMAQFAAGVGMSAPRREQPSEPTPQQLDEGARRAANLAFWMEHELRQYPMAELDSAALAADKLILAVGAESKDTLPGLPNYRLAAQLGLDVREFPGDHIGYLGHPVEFADALAATLAAG